jgi:hypothetical protein
VRLTIRKGHQHPLAKFTPAQIAAIRTAYEQSPATSFRALAREWGCHHMTILRIVHRFTYEDRW